MFKHVVRNPLLILTVAAFITPTMHASAVRTHANCSTALAVTAGGPTGGDPEPPGPDTLRCILPLLYLA